MYIKAISHPRELHSYSRILEAKDFHVATFWDEGNVDPDHPVISRIDVTVEISPGAENARERSVELILTAQADHNWDQVYVMNDAGDTIQSISCN